MKFLLCKTIITAQIFKLLQCREKFCRPPSPSEPQEKTPALPESQAGSPTTCARQQQKNTGENGDGCSRWVMHACCGRHTHTVDRRLFRLAEPAGAAERVVEVSVSEPDRPRTTKRESSQSKLTTLVPTTLHD